MNRLTQPSANDPIRPRCQCFVVEGMYLDPELGVHRCKLCHASERTEAKSDHQTRVEEFMCQIGHLVAGGPTVPSRETLLSRATFIAEEASEALGALGYRTEIECYSMANKLVIARSVAADRNISIESVAKELADLSVVTTGTFSAFGIADQPVLEAVDHNNLQKVKPHCPKCGGLLQWNADIGAWECLHAGAHMVPLFYSKEVGGYRRADSKWIKGTAHPKVDLHGVLAAMLT